ncbi:type I methionyl aminopeptidase [bacterium]|jgi:methionyl aminopeptidase|nr:type I methionyl aminopeptidase [bacterium]
MIILKSPKDIESMRKGGAILASVFTLLKSKLKVGVSAKFLDDLAREHIIKSGGVPSFLGYRGFKYTLCVSRNEEVVHGLANAEKIVLPGDVWSVDCGVFYEGFHVDAARTFVIEPVTKEVAKLVRVTQESFFECVKSAKHGNRLGKVSNALQTHVEDNGFSVVRDLYSHGVGKELHEDPLIPNFGKKDSGVVMKSGMTFAIEPMVNMGSHHVLTLPDKWTIITRDKKFSAHYENTICITDGEPEILTLER